MSTFYYVTVKDFSTMKVGSRPRVVVKVLVVGADGLLCLGAALGGG